MAYRWRSELMSSNVFDDLEFTHLDLDRRYEPLQIASETSAMLQECDAVLAHYEPGEDQAQTGCELLMAKRFDLPIVVWTDQFTSSLDDLSPWWHYVATKFCQTGRTSLNSTYELL